MATPPCARSILKTSTVKVNQWWTKSPVTRRPRGGLRKDLESIAHRTATAKKQKRTKKNSTHKGKETARGEAERVTSSVGTQVPATTAGSKAHRPQDRLPQSTGRRCGLAPASYTCCKNYRGCGEVERPEEGTRGGRRKQDPRPSGDPAPACSAESTEGRRAGRIFEEGQQTAI
jgi:hypothetical protein